MGGKGWSQSGIYMRSSMHSLILTSTDSTWQYRSLRHRQHGRQWRSLGDQRSEELCLRRALCGFMNHDWVLEDGVAVFEVVRWHYGSRASWAWGKRRIVWRLCLCLSNRYMVCKGRFDQIASSQWMRSRSACSRHSYCCAAMVVML